MTGKCRPMIGKCRGVDREMPANDREMPPMTGKCHPLLEVVDFDQKLMKTPDLGKTMKWSWWVNVPSWHCSLKPIVSNLTKPRIGWIPRFKIWVWELHCFYNLETCNCMIRRPGLTPRWWHLHPKMQHAWPSVNLLNGLLIEQSNYTVCDLLRHFWRCRDTGWFQLSRNECAQLLWWWPSHCI